MIDTKHAKAICEAATAGEWWAESGVVHAKAPEWTEENRACIHPVWAETDEDATFFAAARTLLPAALEEIDTLHQLLRRAVPLLDICEECDSDCQSYKTCWSVALKREIEAALGEGKE